MAVRSLPSRAVRIVLAVAVVALGAGGVGARELSEVARPAGAGVARAPKRTEPPTTFTTPGLYVVGSGGTGLVRLAGGASFLGWSPDGTRLAFSDGGALRVVAADGSRERTLAGAPNAVRPVWSPDGTRIAYSSGAGVFVVPADGTGPPTLVDAHAILQAWSPDGRLSAVRDGDVVVYERDGTARVLVTGHWAFTPPAWSPDGTRLAFVSHGVEVVGADGTGLQAVTGTCCVDASPVVWSSDGRHLATEDHGDVLMVDADTGDGGFVAGALSPTWSPRGLRLAFLAITPAPDGRGDVDDLAMVDADGGNRRKLADVPPTLWAGALSWSPSGNLLAFVANPR